MGRYITLLLFIGLTWGQKEYNINHIVEQDSVYKKKFSDEIVNGNVYKMFDDMKVPRGKMQNGEKEGIWIVWYSIGTIKSKTSWKNGNISGTCYNYREDGTIEFRTENINSNDYTKFFYDNSGNSDGYSMEYRFGKMYQGREKISYSYIDPKVLYYEEGNLTKTEYISRKTGEVKKDTRILRMKRRISSYIINEPESAKVWITSFGQCIWQLLILNLFIK